MFDFEKNATNRFRSVVASTWGKPTNPSSKGNAKNDEDIKLILRSNGEPFPNQSQPMQTSKPPYVVAFAYLQKSDTFILFVFSPIMIPCRLVRFDRSGATINKTYEETSDSFLWGVEDAAVIAAAAEICEEHGYFQPSNISVSGEVETGQTKVNTNITSNEEITMDVDTSSCDRSEYLRLVSMEELEECEHNREKEIHSIRRLITNDFFGVDKKIIKHPDPNFLLSLSRSISETLLFWRSLCKDLPPVSDLPEMQVSMPLEYYEYELTENRGHGMFEPGSKERQEYDTITRTREAQFQFAARMCLSSLCKIKSLLNKMIRSIDDSKAVSPSLSFRLAKECMGCVASLEYQQENDRRTWFDDYHMALDNVRCEVDIDENPVIFKQWLERGDFENGQDIVEAEDASEDDADEAIPNWEVENVDESKIELDIHGAAELTIRTWHHEDRTLLKTLHSITARIEKALELSDAEDLNAVYEEIESAEEEVELLNEESRKRTSANAARLVKLWNDEHFDFENHEISLWEREGAWPRWTNKQADAFASFGYDLSQGMDNERITFAIDHIGITSYLGSKIDVLDGSMRECMNDCGSDQVRNFGKTWNSEILPAFETLIQCAQKFIDGGDLFNASHLAVSASKVLCDKESAGKIAKKFWCSNGEEIIMEHFQGVMKLLDAIASKIALRYVDEMTTGNHKRISEACWLYNVLISGVMFFPMCKASQITWSSKCFSESSRPEWFVFKHVASFVFIHGGWNHPVLLRALEGDEASIRLWARLEPPSVLTERFLVLKCKGNTSGAIILSKMIHGKEAMAFLVQCGCVNEAIAQATSSQNIEGLSQIASDLVHSNPQASLLCAQASILCSVQNNDNEGTGGSLPKEGIDTILRLFVQKWTDSLADGVEKLPSLDGHTFVQPEEGMNKDGTSVCTRQIDRPSGDDCVPSLRLLSIISACSSFALAAKSTSLMQNLLDRKSFGQSGICLATAAIAVATQANSRKIRHNSLMYIVEKLGLLSTNTHRDQPKIVVAYSGMMAQPEPRSHASKELLDIYCAIYACAKLLTSEENESNQSTFNVHLFEISLFAAIQIAILSGYDYFALETIQAVRQCIGKKIEWKFSYSPWNTLTACYSIFFACSSSKKIGRIAEGLLRTFVKYPPKQKNWDVIQGSFWVIVALTQYRTDISDLGALYCDLLLEDKHALHNIERGLEQLHLIDTEDWGRVTPAKYCTMKSFEKYARRKIITEKERETLCTAFIVQLFHRQSNLRPYFVAECVRVHRSVNPSFWDVEADQVKQRLLDNESLTLCLSEEKNLKVMTMVLYFVDHSNQRGDTWSSNFFILVFGLRWLRMALGSVGDLVQFNHSEKLDSRKYFEFKREWRTLFQARHWDERRFDEHNHHDVEKSPKFAAYALSAVTEANAHVVEQNAPHLAHVCKEAVGLCRALRFVLGPSPQLFSSYSEFFNQNKNVLPSHLGPRSLVSTVLQRDWCCTTTSELYEHERAPTQKQKKVVPMLLSRVYIALEIDMIQEACALCMAACDAEELISDKIGINSNDSKASLDVKCDILQGFLLTLKHAAVNCKELPRRFIDMAYHVTLTMNWFSCCHACVPESSTLSKKAQNFVPNIGNMELLHNFACSVGGSFGQRSANKDIGAFAYFLKMISCLSRCCGWFEVVGSRSGCTHRHLTPRRYCTEIDTKQTNVVKIVEDAKKRKLPNLSDVQRDFSELQSYIDPQVCSRNCALDWCNDALQNITGEFEEKAAKRLASKNNLNDFQ